MPIDVERIVEKAECLDDQYQIILEEPEGKRLKVRVKYSTEVKNLKALREKVEEAFSHDLGIGAAVDRVPVVLLNGLRLKLRG